MRSMSRLQKRRISILYRYIASYVSMALFACCALISFSNYAASIRLKAEVRQHQAYQLLLLSEDLQRRFDEMESIVLDIAISPEFKPTLFRRNPYYETQLVEGLSKYTQRTLLDTGIFLIYESFDAVYTEKAKYSMDIFCRDLLECVNPEKLAEEIRSTEEFAVFLKENFRQNMQLWCFPLRILGEQEQYSQGTVAFLVEEGAFQVDFARVVGELPGDITVSFRGVPLARIGGPLQETREVLTAVTENGLFELTMAPNDVQVYNHAILSAQGNLIFLIVLVVAIFALGILMALGNYRPIQRVYNRQAHVPGVPSGVDELQALEMMMDSYRSERQQNSEHIAAQLQMLRHQMLCLILNGRERTPNSRIMQELGIGFPHGYFFVAVVAPDRSAAQAEGTLMQISRELASPAVSSYVTLSDEGNLIAILVNVMNLDLRRETMEQFMRCIKQAGLTAMCGVSSCVAQMNRLRMCFIEAVSALNAAGDASLIFYEDLQSQPVQLSKRLIETEALESALRTGQSQEAQKRLKELIQAICASTPSIPMRLYFCTCALNRLVQLANAMKIAISQEQLGWLYTSASVENFCDGMAEIVWEICDARINGTNDDEDAFARRIVSFVDEHCLDYAMSLDMLAEHFSMSASQVSRLFRSATNEAFKDYIIRRRVSYAQHLILTENISVAELCSRTGYSNVSHFIKVFKAQTGVTPAAYRRQLQDEGQIKKEM